MCAECLNARGARSAARVVRSLEARACGGAQLEGPVQVARRSDMDMNGHINNVTYLNWALETVPADVYLNFSLQQARRWPARAAAAVPQPRAATAAGRSVRCSQDLRFVVLARLTMCTRQCGEA